MGDSEQWKSRWNIETSSCTAFHSMEGRQYDIGKVFGLLLQPCLFCLAASFSSKHAFWSHESWSCGRVTSSIASTTDFHSTEYAVTSRCAA